MEGVRISEEQSLIQNPSIKLKRGVRGDYGWEIFLSGEDMEKVLKEIEIANNKLISKHVRVN